MDRIETLKQINSNGISWYDFKENTSRWEVGEDIKEALTKIGVGEKFDYIVLKNHLEDLEIAKQYLNPDGTILLVMNNRFGIANFAGQDGFCSIYEEKSDYKTKQQIEDFLKKQGFSHYKFFYPLPNYEIANAIFSDDYLPEYNHTKLMNANIYSQDCTIVLDEKKALQQLTKAGEFKNFANSYLIEINPKTKIKFVSFNNNRKKEYRLCTKLYPDCAIKQPMGDDAKAHIQKIGKNIQDLKEHGIEILDREENGKIISPYMAEKNFYEILIELIKAQKIDEVYQLIKKWFEELQTKFKNDRTENMNQEIFTNAKNISQLHFVKNAYIDLVFENTFVEEDQFVFFDQEWVIPNLPLEFILYRAINNLYLYHSEIEKQMAKKDCLEKFELLSQLPLFEEAEKKIQNLIEDETMKLLYQEAEGCIKDVNQLKWIDKKTEEILARVRILEIEEKKKETYIEKLTKEKGDLKARVGLLETEEKKKEQYIDKLTLENNQKVEEVHRLEAIQKNQQNDIEHLNEIIKVKDNQIEQYENMKSVKLAKKLRGKK